MPLDTILPYRLGKHTIPASRPESIPLCYPKLVKCCFGATMDRIYIHLHQSTRIWISTPFISILVNLSLTQQAKLPVCHAKKKPALRRSQMLKHKKSLTQLKPRTRCGGGACRTSGTTARSGQSWGAGMHRWLRFCRRYHSPSNPPAPDTSCNRVGVRVLMHDCFVSHGSATHPS